ncbi:Very-long-chain (3R)-3-hydroxyacyl-CoA dehydratase PASTICCINO 2, partial [Nowakowskiella sp. JEL0407]
QGPSYALAKRIQHWRAIVARFSTGVIVSSNIAPSTSTPSVVSNPQFALAMKGVGYFKPMEVFEPNTSNAIMTALLFHDLRNKYGVSSPNVDVANPLLLFTDGAVHGGIWRLPFKLSSIFVPALLFALLDGWVGAVILLGVVGGVGIGMRQ